LYRYYMMCKECTGLPLLTLTTKSLTLRLCDSLFKKSPPNIIEKISCILNTRYPEIIVEYVDCQRQSGSHDCGMFAIALAISLCFGNQPGRTLYSQSKMRAHLLHCLNNGIMEEFPQKERRFKMKIANRQIINVYCSCRMPRMLDMILCDQFKEWYHAGICITLPQSLYLMKTRRWLCDNCTKYKLILMGFLC